METGQGAVLARVAAVVGRTFRVCQKVKIDRHTTSTDIDGWDSLSHALLIMGVEEEFGVSLPFDEVYQLGDVGELVDLICKTRASAPGRPGIA